MKSTYQCSKCHEAKSYDDYHKDKTKSHGIDSICKHCRKELSVTPQKRLASYKYNAKKRNLTFTLQIETFDFLTQQPCHYCGKHNHTGEHTGIDRLDNTIGYTVQNCVPCCWLCNKMKNSMHYKEFLSHLASIVKHLQRIG